MNTEKVLELISNTSEEYKSVLGGEFKRISDEINRIRIKNTNISNKGDADLVSDFTFSTNEGDITIKVIVKREVLPNEDNIFHEVLQTSQELTRMTFLSYWNSSNTGKKDILEYYLDFDMNLGKSNFTNKDQFHRVYPENCEELKNLLLPSCELIYFFDILILSLIRSSTSHLAKQTDLEEVTSLFRNSMIEDIAAGICTSTESEDNTSGSESDSEVDSKKKCKRNI
ncbi:hypothetical protein RS030_71031 [Cryptosporidium xiaoi]|uniref:Uncharacterized protein n=1 Tax=Cryptosporidium xiaoi TaxID=659607 RepID=A0AAV9XU31_9CRYT